MDSRPATLDHQVAPEDVGALLATKLYVPRVPPGFVSRTRLVTQLENGLDRALILVCASAGFGKTALLTDWARSGRRLVAWLSLDAGDNDPARFWRHVGAALDRVRPGIANRIAPLLDPRSRASFDALVTALINELTAEPDDAMLILDDYDLIDAPPVHTSLAFLIEHLPPSMHLGVASRTDPALPLARLRARGRIFELRDRDLRFTATEAASLLREVVGPDLPGDVMALLVNRTEGWAAGLQLAALSLQGKADVVSFMKTFSGSNRYVIDYLTEEVLERQPLQVRDFLLSTAVLDRLSAPLCDAVTGRTDGQAMLETLERANVFLVPLDEVRGWWRFHNLFSDLLRHRLEQQEPTRVGELHAKAATWFEEHGFADDAVRHALAAGDATSAARLIERHADALILRGEGATLQRWLAALPIDLVGARPRLLLSKALLALLSGRPEAVAAPLEAAERVVAEDVDEEPYEPSVGRAASALANVRAAIDLDRAHLAELCGDADRAMDYGQRAVAQIGEGEAMLDSIARARLAVARWMDGQLDEGERALVDIVDEWRTADASYLAVRGCHYLAQIRLAQGRLQAALATYQRALEIAAPTGQPPLPVAGDAYVGLAALAYQQGDLQTAVRNITDGIALCRQLAYTQPVATGLATLAWIRNVTGDVAGALDAINEAVREAPSSGVADLLNPVPAQRARLLMSQGDVTTAADWTKDRGLTAEDEPTYPREPAYLVLARVLLAEDLPDRALGLLARLHAQAAVQGRTGSLIEIDMLKALAHAAAGDEPTALTALAETLMLARTHGYVRVFADEGRPVANLLGRLVAAQRMDRIARAVPVHYVARLLKAFSVGHPSVQAEPSVAAAHGLVEHITARELEVLRLLATGRSNHDIAAELVVTIDTVKKHVTHILDKLGAANRTQATARARALGILKDVEDERRQVAHANTT